MNNIDYGGESVLIVSAIVMGGVATGYLCHSVGIGFLMVAIVSVTLATCNATKNTHNKNYGKMKNKSIKVKTK